MTVSRINVDLDLFFSFFPFLVRLAAFRLIDAGLETCPPVESK
jgi:hypothetical protein